MVKPCPKELKCDVEVCLNHFNYVLLVVSSSLLAFICGTRIFVNLMRSYLLFKLGKLGCLTLLASLTS